MPKQIDVVKRNVATATLTDLRALEKRVAEIVGAKFHIAPEFFVPPSRRSNSLRTALRSICMYVLYTNARLLVRQCAAAYGHSTNKHYGGHSNIALQSVRRVESWRDDESFDALISKIEKACGGVVRSFHAVCAKRFEAQSTKVKESRAKKRKRGKSSGKH